LCELRFKLGAALNRSTPAFRHDFVRALVQVALQCPARLGRE